MKFFANFLCFYLYFAFNYLHYLISLAQAASWEGSSFVTIPKSSMASSY